MTILYVRPLNSYRHLLCLLYKSFLFYWINLCAIFNKILSVFYKIYLQFKRVSYSSKKSSKNKKVKKNSEKFFLSSLMLYNIGTVLVCSCNDNTNHHNFMIIIKMKVMMLIRFIVHHRHSFLVGMSFKYQFWVLYVQK